MVSQAVGGQESGLEVIGQVERLKSGGRFSRREFGSCWRSAVCVEGGVWRRAQVEGFLSGWDGYLSGWEGYLRSWDGYLSDLRGAAGREGAVGGGRGGDGV